MVAIVVIYEGHDEQELLRADSLAVQGLRLGAQALSLVRELDPTCGS